MVSKSKFQQFILKLLPHRLWVQIAFLLVWLDPLAIRMHNMCSPVFHCYACPLATFACPIGVIAQFSALHMIPFVAIGLLLVVAGTFGHDHLRLGLPIRACCRTWQLKSQLPD